MRVGTGVNNRGRMQSAAWLSLVVVAFFNVPGFQNSGVPKFNSGSGNGYKKLWANGPHVDARQFALVENGRQLLRGLHAALALETKPTANGDAARKAVLTTLGNMR